MIHISAERLRHVRVLGCLVPCPDCWGRLGGLQYVPGKGVRPSNQGGSVARVLTPRHCCSEWSKSNPVGAIEVAGLRAERMKLVCELAT